MSHPKETQKVCIILLESEMVMKILPLKCVDLAWNDPAEMFGLILLFLSVFGQIFSFCVLNLNLI
jgi:hypothetical protein